MCPLVCKLGVIFVPCYHPMKGFVIGKTENGKNKLKIVSGRVDHLELRNGNWMLVDVPYRSPYADSYISDSVLIPCGQCIGCRMEYSARWADRLMLERKYHDHACFITLTYDEEHAQHLRRPAVDLETGEIVHDPYTGEEIFSLSLDKRDFQLFMKKLRKKFEPKPLRFFASGEYGETLRPHFHMILFGEDFTEIEDDLYDTPKVNPLTGKHYRSSHLLESIWEQGFCVVEDCTYESCAYVARYVAKKLKGKDAQFYEEFNIVPPFSLMSRKPGIASQYYDDHKEELLELKSISIEGSKKHKDVRIPKYYDSKFELDFPKDFSILKDRRKEVAIASLEAKLKKTNLDLFEYLEVEERKRKESLKALKRSVQ